MRKASSLAAEAWRTRRTPQNSEVKPLDPISAIVAGDADLVRLIGLPVAPVDKAWPDDDAPSMVEAGPGGVYAARVVLTFRGARVTAPKAADQLRLRRFKVGDEDKIHWSAGHGVESERLYSFDALQEAAEAARQALRRAGCVLAPLVDCRQAHGGQSATATIHVRRLSPALARGPSMAR